jgi:hypothetical protein
MDLFNLWAICITAFLSVFIILTVIAGVMQAITACFPETGLSPQKDHVLSEQAETSAIYIAAITSTVQSLIPGSQVTRIEEIK